MAPAAHTPFSWTRLCYGHIRHGQGLDLDCLPKWGRMMSQTPLALSRRLFKRPRQVTRGVGAEPGCDNSLQKSILGDTDLCPYRNTHKINDFCVAFCVQGRCLLRHTSTSQTTHFYQPHSSLLLARPGRAMPDRVGPCRAVSGPCRTVPCQSAPCRRVGLTLEHPWLAVAVGFICQMLEVRASLARSYFTSGWPER